jgi:hypothetical protein
VVNRPVDGLGPSILTVAGWQPHDAAPLPRSSMPPTPSFSPGYKQPEMPTDASSGLAGSGSRPSPLREHLICDFSRYSRLHGIVYQEIIAGRGHRIEDAAGAVKLAERACQMAETELPAAH